MVEKLKSMPKYKPTFGYLKRNIVDAFKILNKYHENLMLGGFTCAVIEFLGRCLVGPKSIDGNNNFNEFISKFLRRQNTNYDKYKSLLRYDLRHGAAHSILPKGAVILSYDKAAKKFHLQLIKDPKTNKYHLVIYSLQFLRDLEGAIRDFISEAQKNHRLQIDYVETIKEISKEGQNFIQKKYKKEFRNAIEEKVEGDIRV